MPKIGRRLCLSILLERLEEEQMLRQALPPLSRQFFFPSSITNAIVTCWCVCVNITATLVHSVRLIAAGGWMDAACQAGAVASFYEASYIIRARNASFMRCCLRLP